MKLNERFSEYVLCVVCVSARASVSRILGMFSFPFFQVNLCFIVQGLKIVSKHLRYCSVSQSVEF